MEDDLLSPPLSPSIPARTLDYTRLREEAAQAMNDASQLQYTVDDAIEAVGLGRFQYCLLLLTGLCWTAESMEMLLLSFIKAPLQCEWAISDARAALITTFVGIGMLIGSSCWGVIGDAYGRRVAFIASTAFTFVFGLVSALSVNYPMLLVARGLVGVGIGGVPVSFSLLMESLPSSKRGPWGMSLAIFWSIGAIFESAIALFIVPTLGWRWLIGVSSLPLGLVLVMSLWLSESPRWLISKGANEEAQIALERAALINGRQLPAGNLAWNSVPTVEERDANIEMEGGPVSERSGIFRPGARSLALKLWWVWLSAAFVYYGLVMLQPELISKENTGARCNYAVRECGSLVTETSCNGNQICSWKGSDTTASCLPVGLERQAAENSACASQLTRNDFLSALWSSFGEVPGVFVAFLIVDIIGRRPLLGYMYGLAATSFVLLLGCIGRQAETAVFFFGRAVSTGAFQGIFLFTNEIYPAKVRASAMGFSSSIARFGLITTPFVAQYLENIYHPAAMWLYFLVAASCVFVTMLIPIETTGRPLLSSMEELVSVLKSGRDEQPQDPNYVPFSKDPSVPGLVRFFRWKARVDGEVAS